MGIRVSVLLVIMVTSASAAPRCELRGKPWIEGRIRGTRATSRALDARRGQEIEVFVAAPGRLDGRAVVFGEGRGRTRWPCDPIDIAWRRVEPRMEHTSTPSPNPGIAAYSNAVVFGPHHGAWIGYDNIEYFESPFEGQGWRLTLRDARPSDPLLAERGGGLGVMRLAALLPGARTAGEDAAFRYSFRAGDDFLGWLTSFFNVPYVFASAGKGARAQAERYIGADCADILVAAMRRAGWKLEYTSVSGLIDKLQRIGSPVLLDKSPTPLRFGRDVRPGDLVALDYVGYADLPREWDHIVVVIEDRGPGGKPDGFLGPEDLVADSGSAAGLHYAPLGEQGLIRIQVLRVRRPGG